MSPGDSGGRRIVITQGVVDDLVTQHVAARGREPSTTELNHLIESYVHDEILYREGVRLGLERDDIVVKRRVRQKIEMIAEEDASTRAPTDADLSAYLTANQARFVQPAILTFEQVFHRTIHVRSAEWCMPWRSRVRPFGAVLTPRNLASRRCCRIG